MNNLPKPYYQDDWATIYNADCRDILPLLPKVDLVLTDPPYIIDGKGYGLAGDRKYLKSITMQNMESGFDSRILNNFDNWFCFCSRRQLVELIQKAEKRNWNLIKWLKTNPTPLVNNNYLPDTEYIVHSFSSGKLYGNYEDKATFIIHPVEKNNFDHPTVKPLTVIKKLILLGSINNDIILDPFAGSGTTLVAAKQLNRKSVGIEIEEKYAEIAAKRLSQEVFDFR